MISVTASLQHCIDMLRVYEQRRRAAGAGGPAAVPSLANAWAAEAGLGAPFTGSGSGMFGSLGSSLFGSGGAGGGSGSGGLFMGGSGQPMACGPGSGNGNLPLDPNTTWGGGKAFIDSAAPAGRQPMGCDANTGSSSLLLGSGGLVGGALGGALGGWGAGAAAGSGSGACGSGGWGGPAEGVAGGIGSVAALGRPVGGLQRAGCSMGSGVLARLALAPEEGSWLQSMGGSLGSGAFALTADAGGLGAGLQRTGGSLGSGALAGLASLPAAPEAGGLGPGFGQGAGCGLGVGAGGLQCAGGSWGSGSLAALVALATASPRRNPELKIEGLVTSPPRGAQRRQSPGPLCADADGKLRAAATDDGGGLSPGSRLAGYQALEARLAGLVSVGSGLSGVPWWLEAAASPRKASRLGPGGEADLAAAAPHSAFLNPPTAGQVRCAVHCSSYDAQPRVGT